MHKKLVRPSTSILRSARRVAIGALASLVTATALAAYPNSTITIVVPFGPGGSTDQIGRTIAAHLQKDLKATVIVENKPGANGSLGNAFVARSKPDGYTLLIGGTDIAASQFIYKDLPFNAEKDFVPIGIVTEFPFLMLIDKKRGIKTVDQYLEYARKNPSKISFSSAGIGNSTHLAGETFKHSAKLNSLIHVPYNSSAQSIQAVVSGLTDFTFDPAISSIAQVTGGRANALAVVAEKRLPVLPDVPTMSELGYKEFDGLSPWSWKGLFAPSATPKEVTSLLQASLSRLLSDPEFQRETEKSASLVVAPRSIEASNEFLNKQRQSWGKIIKQYAPDAK